MTLANVHPENYKADINVKLLKMNCKQNFNISYKILISPGSYSPGIKCLHYYRISILTNFMYIGQY